ncbi:NB-ARC domain-containing protein [Crossiella cryophila]|uniref:Tetratricopeptide (TPR) repeat protein n=1 Tax=Crossiella cryophila TaxID=43355 RepID=A0A7W7CFX6_9PSEU|nr:NB-ARC domain-containing protein [Crossiella cryophila]MBB4679096.1 tetratricopeptide (TPR) repeat protein [Crossiella cryophila]
MIAFHNRLDELDQVRAWLTGSRRWVALTGPAGIGKSVLQAELAYRLGEDFDRVLFGSFEGDVPPADVYAELLRQLGVAEDDIPVGDPARIALIRRECAGSRVLVVLDDVRVAGQFTGLLPALKGCAVLLSCRQKLEALAFHGFAELRLAEFSEDAAVEMVSSMIERAGEPAEVRELVEVCGRLPLALRAAAAYLHAWSEVPLREYIARIRRDGAGGLEVDGEKPVEAILRVTFTELSPAAADACRLLAFLPGTRFGLFTVTELLGLEEAARDAVLRELERAFVLQREQTRFSWHRLTAQYAESVARAYLVELPAEIVRIQTGIVEGHARRTIALAKALYSQRELEGPLAVEIPAAEVTAEVARRELDADAVTLREMQALAQRLGRGELIWQVSHALCRWYYDTNRYEELVDTRRFALSVTEDPLARMVLLNELGHGYEGLGRPAEATAAFEDSLTPARELRHPRYLAACLEGLGLAAEQSTHYAKADALLAEAEETATGPTRPRSLALYAMHRGRIARKAGDPHTAAAKLDEAKSRFADADTGNLARIRLERARVHRALGERTEAETAYRDALDQLIAAKIPDKQEEAQTELDDLRRELDEQR